MLNVIEITEDLMDALFENEIGFDPLYDINWDDELPSEAYKEFNK